CRDTGRSSGLAHDAQAGDPRQHHADGTATTLTGTEPGRKHLAVHPRQLALEPH
uniref:Uncharacterized protein n=1 Tax=Hippocampus comes TaxID=109280 RepID=A0A3Q2YUZ5_HIPCM